MLSLLHPRTHHYRLAVWHPRIQWEEFQLEKNFAAKDLDQDWLFVVVVVVVVVVCPWEKFDCLWWHCSTALFVAKECDCCRHIRTLQPMSNSVVRGARQLVVSPPDGRLLWRPGHGHVHDPARH